MALGELTTQREDKEKKKNPLDLWQEVGHQLHSRQASFQCIIHGQLPKEKG